MITEFNEKMPNSILRSLIKAEKLFDTGRYKEAFNLLDDIEQRENLTLYDVINDHLLKIELLFQQGKYKKVLLNAESTYKESLELGINPLSVESLVWRSRALIFLDKLNEAYDLITRCEELLNKMPQQSTFNYRKSKAFMLFIKGYFYQVKGVAEKSLKIFYQSLKIYENLGIKHKIAESLCWIVIILCKYKGKLDYAKSFADRGLILARESGKKFYIAFNLTSLAVIYTYQGDFNKCIPLFEESLAIFRELNNRRMIAISLNNIGEKYRMKGNLDRALDYLEESLSILIELNNKRDIANVYDFLIQILIDKGQFTRAEVYLKDLEKLNYDLREKNVNQLDDFLRALLLKSSPRLHNRVKSVELLTQLLEDKNLLYELSIRVLINLCELYLIELKIIGSLEVLDDLNPLIIKLLDIAKKSNSYWVLSETYLLQAKLSLLTFNIKKSQILLTKAQEIAESHGIKFLAIKISHEHDKLIKQINLWKNLKEVNASLSERFEFAGVTEQMEYMLQKRMTEVSKLPDEKPVLLLILSTGGVPIFTRSFGKSKKFEDHLFGGFFAALNSFTNEMFSAGLERASFGKYTLLLKKIPPFLTCYLYKGQSYSAQTRIKLFNNKIMSNKDTWDTLKSFYHINRIIQNEDIPSLEQLIMKIFITKNDKDLVFLIH